MSKTDRFIAISVVLSIIVGIASTHIDSLLPIGQSISYALIVFITFWIISLIIRWLYNTYTYGRFAVQAYMLNEQLELLMFFHPYHKMHMPPGGRMEHGEFPDEALIKRLAERLGLSENQYKLVDISLEKSISSADTLGRVQRIVPPVRVQKEYTRQRNFKKFHYDLIYVGFMKKHAISDTNSRYAPIRFYSYNAVRQMHARKEIPPDVLDTFGDILLTLKSRNANRTARDAATK